MKTNKWYKIKIMPLNEDEQPYIFKVKTPDINWTMEQYQRNREPFEWKML